MPYIGNQAVVGDSANTFKTLDGIASFTVTFDATDSGVVSIANNTLTFNNHRFVTGQKVTYNDGGGTAIGGLSDGSYFIIKEDQSTIKLASSASNAAAGTAIDLTSGAAGGSHTLNIAFDGVNTKFKATHTNGIKAKVSRPAQITLSINGVIQQPTADYTIESDSTLVFSQAPESTDKIFASFIGEVAASFDLTDNTVDEFTANGSLTTFTLSKTVPSSNDVLVTLDGVTQYPTTQSNTRAYSVLENVLTFTSAPAAGVIIQVRHIGFAGATSQSVTGFYGRTGNVQLKNTDNVAVNNLTVAGNLDVTGDLTYDETVSRNLNVTGVATVASGIVSTGDFKIGTATTLSQDNIFTTGIITATSFVGSGANLTGVASTENIRTNTNATFLQNVTVVGTSTVTGNIVPSSDSATDIGTNSVRFQNAYVDTYYGDGSNLTGIAATANVRTGILDVAGISTFRNTVNIGAAVTISESGIEASGIGITIANINGNQIGGRRNLIINGAMKVAQRGTSNTGLDGYGSVDRFYPDKNQLDNLQGTQEQVGITDLPGFTNAFKLDITTAETALAADEYFTIGHRIEAQDLQQLSYGTSSAKSMTLSFHVKSSTTGTYVVSCYQADGGRLITATYTINSANTWEKKVITFPGNTGVAIDNNTDQGLQFNFGLAAGSNWTSANTTSWTSYSDAGYLYGQTANLIAQTGTFFLTGVQLELGTEATAFEHRTFAEELRACQRYYYRIEGNNDDVAAFGFASSSSDNYFNIQFPVPMRAYPTYTGSATAARFQSGNNGQDFNLDSLGYTANTTHDNPIRIMLYVNQGGTSTGYGGALSFQENSGVMQFSAEI